MDFSDQDKLLINDLINIAWQAGAVKAPQMAQAVETLRAKLQKPKEPPAVKK
jgi:hypothetical protein